MYIMDEHKFINDVVNSREKPPDLSMNYLITLLIKKYFSENHIYGYDLVNVVKAKLNEFNISGYQEYKFHKKISQLVDKLCNDKELCTFKNIEYVPIYQSEIDKISALDNDRKKKFLFTVYAVARFMDSNGWINKKDLSGITEIFKLANISLTQKDKLVLIHELYKDGYISFSKRVDNLNIRVELSDGKNDSITYKVYDFNNLGNQYIGNFKDGYKQCAICGKKIKSKGNRHKYCDACARQKHLESKRNNMKKLRET